MALRAPSPICDFCFVDLVPHVVGRRETRRGGAFGDGSCPPPGATVRHRPIPTRAVHRRPQTVRIFSCQSGCLSLRPNVGAQPPAICSPPSIVTVLPVTQCMPGAERATIARPTSSGVVSRFPGCFFMTTSIHSWLPGIWRSAGVSTTPGEITFTRTGARSSARPRPNASTAAFVAETSADPNAAFDGRTALLDFGITGRLDDTQRLAFLRLLLGGAGGDVRSQLEALRDLGAFPRDTDIDAVIVNVAGCGSMLKDYGHIAEELAPRDSALGETLGAFAGKVRRRPW